MNLFANLSPEAITLLSTLAAGGYLLGVQFKWFKTIRNWLKQRQAARPNQRHGNISPENPAGNVPLDSPFYIPRPPIEQTCYEEIDTANALLRIKAARQMGKTSLMVRILNHAQQQKNHTIKLSLQSITDELYQDLDKLLRWFCQESCRQLKLPGISDSQLNDFWSDDYDSKMNARHYFEDQLLPHIDHAVVIAIDEVDRLFVHPKVASEFFGLLRNWHEDGKNPGEIWYKLRLILVHSREVYIQLNANQSPFNVGTGIDLPHFNRQQTQQLVKAHGLHWTDTELDKLIDLLGGQPYLLRRCLYEIICRSDETLQSIIDNAHTDAGIFVDHLHNHQKNIQNHQLASELSQIVHADYPIEVPHQFALIGMGLVIAEKNAVRPSCDLYRRYFQHCLAQ